MNSQLIKLHHWMCATNLMLNVDKTNFMIFGVRHINDDNLHLYYNNQVINRVSSIKFLGVIMYDTLSWNHHTNQLCNTISRNIGILRKLQFLPRSVYHSILIKCILLYHSLISSHLSYCAIIWVFSSKHNLNRILLLQKRAHYLQPSAPLFSRMSILPIHSIVSLQTCICMHNCYSDKLPSSLNNYFNLNCSVHVYNTRNKNNFHPPLLRTELFKSTIVYQGPVLWNDLPVNLKKLKSPKQFNYNYKRQLLQSEIILTICVFEKQSHPA